LEGVKESGLEASIDRSLRRQSPVSVCTLVEGKPKRIATAKQLVCGIPVAVTYQHYRNVKPMTEPTLGVTAVILPPLRPLITMPAEIEAPEKL
jgi:hypothetical protein